MQLSNMELVAVVVLVLVQSSLIQAHEVVPLYRLYNTRTGNHFYTTSATEATSVASHAHFKLEGMAGSVSTGQCDYGQLTAVYRLYRSGIKDDHFYTTSDVEASNAVSKHAYKREGIAFYCAENINECDATLGFNRYYRGTDHFYTTNLVEGHKVAADGGTFEGTMCYIWPVA